jgi:hypothetical protein
MIDVDDSRWPLVLIEYRGSISMAELKRFLAELDRLLERRQPLVAIADISALRTPGPDLLRRQAAWYRARESSLREFCLASATVANSAMVRGILKAVNWLHPMPQPQTVVETAAEALDFVEQKLKERQLALPPSTAQLREKWRHPPNR